MKKRLFPRIAPFMIFEKIESATKMRKRAFINISEQAKSRLLISLRLGNDIYEILPDMAIQCCIAEEQARLKRII